VLRGLATIGIVRTDDGVTYELAPLGHYLRSDVPDSVLPAARLMTHPIASRAWGVHAIWLPAGFLAITLCLFIIDEQHMR